MNKQNYENYSYDDFLSVLTIEFSDFLRDADYAKDIRHSCLKSRKKSIRLRELLKIFRIKSLEQEKYLNYKFKKRQESSIVYIDAD